MRPERRCRLSVRVADDHNHSATAVTDDDGPAIHDDEHYPAIDHDDDHGPTNHYDDAAAATFGGRCRRSVDLFG